MRCVYIGNKKIGELCLTELKIRGIKPIKTLSDDDDWSIIPKLKPDIIFCIGSLRKVSKEILDCAKDGVINIHPALLPRFRGRYSIPHMVFRNEKWGGATLHYMSEHIDAGDIAVQEMFTIDADDTSSDVWKKFNSSAVKAFNTFLDLYLSGKPIKRIKQDDALATESYTENKLPHFNMNFDVRKLYRYALAMTNGNYGIEPIPFGKRVLKVSLE